MPKTQKTAQAPDATSAAADGGESTRKQVSKRYYLNTAGSEIDAIEEASGARYVLLDPAGNHTFDQQMGVAGKLPTMCAIMGFHTKIGNVANTVLNDAEEPGGPSDAAAAIKAWLEQVEGGKWAERTTGGVGARIDRDALADAIVAVGMSSGKVTAADQDATRTKVRARLEAEPAYVRAARQVPDVAAEYATRVGKASKTVDDLL